MASRLMFKRNETLLEMSSVPRQWTEPETEAFVCFMEEMVIGGFRADAGQFKSGAFTRLTEKMNEKFPGCGLTISHCRNKHKRLKEKYQYVAEMLNTSGFSWNGQRQCVDMHSRDVWVDWAKAHNKTLYTPGKPFLLYERLEGIFGKDRAGGTGVVSFGDAEEEMQKESAIPDEYDDMDILPDTSAQSSSSAQKGKRKLTSSRSKDSLSIEKLADSVADALESQREEVQIIANAITGVNTQTNLSKTLKSLGFTYSEIVRIAKKFSQNPEWKQTFWSLDEEKEESARDILND